MRSKFFRRLLRRAQFASLVAGDPARSKAMYRLIAAPQSVDAFSLDGLSESVVLDRLKSSSLISTGNYRVPLKVAENLYLNGRIDEAFGLLRSSPGRDAQLLDGWLSLYNGDLQRAGDIFSAATDRQATKIEACKNLALCRYLEGDLDRALDALIVGAAISPRTMAPMTLFSRIVRHKEDIGRYLSEKMRLAKNGFTASSAAQFVRACGRAGATEEGERAAKAAVINLVRSVKPAATPSSRHAETGLKKGFYSRDKGAAILSQVLALARGAGIRLFPVGGTLLGLIRDAELLSWDKDLDFGCFEEEASLEDLWTLFSASPYFIPMGTAEDRLIKLRHLSGVTVDIFVNFRDGDARWHGGQFVFWKDQAFDLKTMTVGGTEVLVPGDPEAYLEGHYGPNWRYPDPHFDVFWEAPNAFSPKIEHRYLNTVAKGLQFLAAGSLDMMNIRLDRAKNADADDVVAGYEYVLTQHSAFSPSGKVISSGESRST